MAKKSEVERKIDERKAKARDLIAAWLNQPKAKPQPVDSAGLQVRFPFDEQKGSTFMNSAPNAQSRTIATTGSPIIWGEGTWFWPYMRMDVSTKLEAPDAGDVDTSDPFTVATWVRPYLRPLEAKDKKRPSGVFLSRADAGQKQRGWQLRADNVHFIYFV